MPAGLGRGRARACGTSDVRQFKSYGDPDVGNPIPPFTTSWLSLWATPTQKHYVKSC